MSSIFVKRGNLKSSQKLQKRKQKEDSAGCRGADEVVKTLLNRARMDPGSYTKRSNTPSHCERGNLKSSQKLQKRKQKEEAAGCRGAGQFDIPSSES
nr:hypothetical protein [Tanacetum cinerariifolium]